MLPGLCHWWRHIQKTTQLRQQQKTDSDTPSTINSSVIDLHSIPISTYIVIAGYYRRGVNCMNKCTVITVNFKITEKSFFLRNTS